MCVSQNYGTVVDEIIDNGAIVAGGELNVVGLLLSNDTSGGFALDLQI